MSFCPTDLVFYFHLFCHYVFVTCNHFQIFAELELFLFELTLPFWNLSETVIFKPVLYLLLSLPLPKYRLNTSFPFLHMDLPGFV